MDEQAARSDLRSAAVAVEDAATLETAGLRDAAALQTAGVREADVLQTQGLREAATLRTAGQRRINLIWEITQSVVAISVTVATLYIAGTLALRGDGNVAAFVLLSNVFFVVVSTYFSRTNHVKEGGVGKGDVGR